MPREDVAEVVELLSLEDPAAFAAAVKTLPTNKAVFLAGFLHDLLHRTTHQMQSLAADLVKRGVAQVQVVRLGPAEQDSSPEPATPVPSGPARPEVH